MNRAAARETVDEANAAIGAAISTCSLSGEIRSLLTEIQYDLLDLAEAIDHREPGPKPDRLHQALRSYQVDTPPRGFAVLGGASDAAGLLKLARAVTRRAARGMTTLTDGSASYLEALGELLLAVAWEAENQELAQLPYGLCGIPKPTSDVVRPAGGYIDTVRRL